MKRFFQAACFVLVIMGNAYSDDLLVPGQYPTIQEGIDAAGNGDTVIVEPGTYKENLIFNTGKDVNVRSSQGAEVTVIDGRGATSVVRFLGAETDHTSLEGFTLTNGSGYELSNATRGGGIYLGVDCYPMLKSLIIRGNQAKYGGGVYGDTATPTLDLCTISNNTAATWGGGVYCNAASDMKLLNCTIMENESDAKGGGIKCKASSPAIVNCIISFNMAAQGAGIHSEGSSEQPAVINTNVVMNQSDGMASGFYCKSKAIVTNSIFWNFPSNADHDIYAESILTFDITYSVVRGGWQGEGNMEVHPHFLHTYDGDFHIVATSPCIDAGDNDCLYRLEHDIDGDLRIVNGQIDIGADEFLTPHGTPGEYYIPDDFASIQEAIDASFPGDVFIVRPGTYTANLEFKGRPITIKSSDGPGQTFLDGDGEVVEDRPIVRFMYLEQSDSVLQGFTLTNGSGYLSYNESFGGAVYCEEASPSLIDLVFEGNRALYGGGFSSFGNEICKLDGCVFRANDAQGGGGIYIGGSATIENCTIENHLTGGGIFANTKGVVTIRNNTVKNNQGGAGVECIGSGEFTVEGNAILNNMRDGAGAGIKLNSHNTGHVIRNNRVIGNVAVQGGGIYTSCDDLLIADNVIASNIAEGHGGGVKCVNGGTFLNNVICYNVANVSPVGKYGVGGGMLFQDADDIRIVNCLLYKNSAERFGGGLYLYGGADMVLDHLTIVNNSAEEEGSGIYTSGLALMTISNSILRNEGRSEIYAEAILPTVVYSNIRNGWYGGSNIDVDPMFVNEAGNDYHLRYESPCRNAGSNDYVVTTEDFEGDPRIAYDIADMGADEFHPHLYYTGNAVPGGNIDLKFIGPPNDTIRLWVGAGVLEEPMQHPVFGDWYLESPILLAMVLGQIPSPDGVFVLPVTIPSDATSIEVPMQAGIGMLLSNPLVLEVQ